MIKPDKFGADMIEVLEAEDHEMVEGFKTRGDC
jgi:hypothetical protein